MIKYIYILYKNFIIIYKNSSKEKKLFNSLNTYIFIKNVKYHI